MVLLKATWVNTYCTRLTFSRSPFYQDISVPAPSYLSLIGLFIFVVVDMSYQNVTRPTDMDLSENHDMETIGAPIALMLLGIGAMALQLVSRRYSTPIQEGLHADDWFLLAALASTYLLVHIYTYI